MNLRDLQYVVSVAEMRSFSRAAQACHVSQSTLSGQIKKLEDWLGVQIFERTNKRVMPTEVGEGIIRSASRVIREIDSIREAAEHAKDPFTGKFRLGAFPTLATYVFCDLVNEITSAYPRLRLVLSEDKTATLVQQLKDGDLDAALLALPVNEDSLVCTPLFEEPFFLAVPESHPLASLSHVDANVLARYRLLLLEEGHCLRDHALDVCQQHNLGEEQAFRASGLETLCQMVRAGTGITLFPQMAIRQDDEGIRYVPFAEPTPCRSIGLFYRKTSAARPIIQSMDSLFCHLYRA